MSERLGFGWLIALILIAALVHPHAFGVSTKFWSTATYEDFAPGNFVGVSLNREGTVTLAPELREVFRTDQAVVWAVVRDQKGNVYLGTGHSGKVFKLGPDLKGSVFYEAPEPDVFALAVDQENQLYVASSPDGKIYKVDASGKGQEFFDPQSKYIWAMAFAPDGSLYVGTGDRGKIFQVAPNGKGQLFYDTHQTHVMTLATAPNNDLIAGSEPNGLLYRFSSAGKAFVLYNAPLSEIHQVALGPDGSIYASALGSAEDRRMRAVPLQRPGAETPVQAGATITVRASQGGGGPGILPGEAGEAGPDAGQKKPDNPLPEQPAPSVVPSFPARSGRAAQSRGIKSAVYRISPDGGVDMLWSSLRENVFDLLPSGDRILFSTDDKGRIYELTPDRRASLLTETDEEETTRLIPYQTFVLAATANLGKLFRVGRQPAELGFYESDVRDAGGIATWGRIRWTADAPPGTSLQLYTRTGNSGRPDATWSDWSTPYGQQSGEQITSPAARYIQWKAVFRSADSRSPVLHEVTVPYVPRNQAPTISDLKVLARAEKPPVTGMGTAPLNPAPVRITGYAANVRPAPPRGYDMSWVATDPDQDELTYNLYFRGEGESEWKLLQGDLKQNYFQLDSDLLPDGKYRLRVIVSDARVNPAGMARTAEITSAPFFIDNAPPELEVKATQRTGASASARFHVFDRTSVLTRAEYVVDAGPPVPLVSDDGIVDSREETFTVSISELDDREHLLTLRVYDSAGNTGVGKALWPAFAPVGAK